MRHLILLSVLAIGLALLPACGDESPSKSGARDAGRTGTKGEYRGPGAAADLEHGLDADLKARVADATAKARAFLLTQQVDNGGFTDRGTDKIQENVSFTAMAVSALVAATPKTQVEKDAAIRQGLEFLVKFQQENGAIVDNPQWRNYCTSASISALAHAQVGDFRQAQARAAAFLEGSQIAGDESDASFGGFPYKQDQGQSADGSNALLATNALEANGLPDDSPIRARVATFVSRIQNRSESNTGEIVVETEDGEKRTVVSGDDGGAIYRVGESKAGMVKRADGKWEFRSYGSMTYAVLKMMLFAGLGPDDPRVQALVGWISENWTVERNPGFENAEDPESAGQQGYFYYLLSAAHALADYEKASGKPLVVRDGEGRRHNWRAEIAKALLDRQQADGSWQNANPRWMEGMKTLATSFAVQTLGHLTGRLD